MNAILQKDSSQLILLASLWLRFLFVARPDERMKLLPYANQVAGSEALLTTEDNDVIFKKRNVNEHGFYLYMLESLKPFTARFRGIIDVAVSVDDGIRYTFEANFPNQLSKLTNESVNGLDMDIRNDIKVEYRTLDVANLTDDPGFRSNQCTNDVKNDSTPALCRVGENPWVERIHSAGRHVRQKDTPIPYIVLENISRKYKRPCILDLKVGTQIYAQESSQEKMRKQLAKSILTTTCSLGMRMSGMQVYQNGAFTCRDKFYGRGLSKEGLRECIRLYFSSGGQVQKEILDNIMKQVSQFKKVLTDLDGYRFFGSSVLVLYEGLGNEDKNGSRQTKADVKIIDFAQVKLPKSELPGPDEGFIFGLTNFLLIMEEIKAGSHSYCLDTHNSEK